MQLLSEKGQEICDMCPFVQELKSEVTVTSIPQERGERDWISNSFDDVLFSFLH
jgi:hypothetical protein